MEWSIGRYKSITSIKQLTLGVARASPGSMSTCGISLDASVERGLGQVRVLVSQYGPFRSMGSSALLADAKTCTTSKNFDSDDVQEHALGLDQPLVCGTISVGYQTFQSSHLALAGSHFVGRQPAGWLSRTSTGWTA
ncbi:MAG: hypothetical protein Q9174_003960 [Haloplaca sp. 1 TL-2023]